MSTAATSPPDPMAIGDAAEHVFDGWAIGRFGNEPFTRDRHGIDRWIELPASHAALVPGVGLDSLPPKLRAVVQVKGTLDASRACPVGLANWKRLVEMSEPCFFVGVVLDDDLRPLRAHVVHVGEEQIARVLRALRELEPGDVSTLHQRELTVAWSADSALVEPGGAAAFVERVRAVVGDPSTYATRKAGWRDHVGYEERPHRLRLRVHGSAEDVAFASVGDGRLAAEVLSHTDVRFDIERTVQDGLPPGRVWVSFDSNAGRDVELRVRGTDSSVTLPGRARLPLESRRLPPTKRFLRFSTVGLALTLVGKNFESITMRHEGLAKLDEARPLRALADASRAIGLLTRERSCDVELVVNGRAHAMRSRRAARPPKEGDPFLLDLATFEWALLVAREAGVPDETAVVPGRILLQQRELLAWAAYLGAARADVQFGVPVGEHAGPACVSMLCIAAIGDRMVVQNLVFRDEQPRRDPDGSLYLHANALSRGAPRAFTREEAATVDPVAIVEAHEAQLEGRRDELLIQSRESIKTEWARRLPLLTSNDIPRLPAPREKPPRSRRSRAR